MSLFRSIREFFTVESPEVQAERLARLAAIVDRGLRSYSEAGRALAEIRDGGLYRLEAKTFEDFCETRWSMTPQHAGRIIAAADLASRLEPTGTIPKTERLARPIASLPEADQVAAWEDAVQLAGDDEIRPAHVAEAVAKRKGARGSKKRPKPTRLRVPGAIVVVEPGRGYTTAVDALTYALQQLEQRKAA